MKLKLFILAYWSRLQLFFTSFSFPPNSGETDKLELSWIFLGRRGSLQQLGGQLGTAFERSYLRGSDLPSATREVLWRECTEEWPSNEHLPRVYLVTARSHCFHLPEIQNIRATQTSWPASPPFFALPYQNETEGKKANERNKKMKTLISDKRRNSLFIFRNKERTSEKRVWGKNPGDKGSWKR